MGSALAAAGRWRLVAVTRPGLDLGDHLTDTLAMIAFVRPVEGRWRVLWRRLEGRSGAGAVRAVTTALTDGTSTGGPRREASVVTMVASTIVHRRTSWNP
jgi:hypothetical protein